MPSNEDRNRNGNAESDSLGIEGQRTTEGKRIPTPSSSTNSLRFRVPWSHFL